MYPILTWPLSNKQLLEGPERGGTVSWALSWLTSEGADHRVF